ncbi:MAG: response regulator transcription factor [Mucilaginibacter sp.]|nr:response regulator transcription factor [Mucilaginibacter sp.]
MKVVIIEDEPRTARELKSILEGIDAEIDVLSILSSVTNAVKWFKDHQSPDLIFSDIQLGDGLSFEIFQQIETPAPVVFCTAYDQYAIAAFDSNGIDYLLKPLEEAMVEKSLNKYRRVKAHLAGDNFAGDLGKAMAQLEVVYKQSLLVHYREKIIPVKTGDIQYVYAANGAVLLHTVTNDDYVVQYTIDHLEQMLKPNSFFRANRQFIINRNVIENIEHYFNRRLFVKLNCTTPEKIIISRLRAQDFLRWIEHF